MELQLDLNDEPEGVAADEKLDHGRRHRLPSRATPTYRSLSRRGQVERSAPVDQIVCDATDRVIPKVGDWIAALRKSSWKRALDSLPRNRNPRLSGATAGYVRQTRPARGPEYYRTPEPPAPATRCPPAGGGRGGRGRSNLAQLILFVQRQEAHPHTSASLAATPVSRVLGNCRCSTARHSLRAARTDGCKRQPERRVPGPCRRAASMESSNPYVVVASAWRTTCWSSATVRPSMTSRLFSACRRRYHRGGVEVGAGRSAKGPVAGNPAPPPPSQSRSTPCPRAGSPCIGVTNPSRHPGAPSLSR
jgi:hypothetical protein